jgi:hypothetical protein
MPRNPPKAAVERDPSHEKEPFKRLRERPGVKVHDVARRSPRER